jgi:hypothetical protein
VDLIYLDPPFNSRQDYNVLFAERDGTRSASQIMAFEDTWEWNMDAESVARLPSAGGCAFGEIQGADFEVVLQFEIHRAGEVNAAVGNCRHAQRS